MKEPPRYILHRLDFADGTIADCAASDWLCELLPLDQSSAALLATPRDDAFGRRHLGAAIKGWRAPRQLREVRYEIRAGNQRARYRHKFKARKGAPRILCDGRRLYADRGNLFLSYPLRALTQRGGQRQRAIQFIN